MTTVFCFVLFYSLPLPLLFRLVLNLSRMSLFFLKLSPQLQICTQILTSGSMCQSLVFLICQSLPTIPSLINFNVLNYFRILKPLQVWLYFGTINIASYSSLVTMDLAFMLIPSPLVGIIKSHLYLDSLSPAFACPFTYGCLCTQTSIFLIPFLVLTFYLDYLWSV